MEAYKLFVFTLSACMAGVAGALYVPQVGIINPSEFAPANSIEAVIWVAVGGRGTLIGAVLGAVLVNYAKTFFTTGLLAPYWLFVLGGLFVAVTLLLPRGIVGTIEHFWAQRRGRRGNGGTGARAGAGSRRSESDGRAHHLGSALSRRRDGVVRRLPRAQQALACGRARRDARHHRPQRRRQDHHDGRDHRQDAAGRRRGLLRRRRIDLTRLDEAAIAELGIGRKFQKPTVFESHTVEDNLRLALEERPARARERCSGTTRTEEKTASTRILETIRLAPLRERLAGSLSHGQKQWLEIGMLLAQEPKLLLVDEPVAGMTDAETRQTAELLKEINRDRTVVVVEHDMAFVRDLGVKVTVLHEGAVIAEGAIDQVSANERVIEVYLGR